MDYHRLTRILIRLLGVSLIAHGIAGVLSGFITFMQTTGLPRSTAVFWIVPASAAIGIVVGIVLIRLSDRLANSLAD